MEVTLTGEKILSYNRQVFAFYNVLKSWEAGMALEGSEVKQLRKQSSINTAFCLVQNSQIYLHDLLPRKIVLLLHKKQIIKLDALRKNHPASSLKVGKLYCTRGFLKIQVLLVEKKRKRDRREELKKRDLSRRIRENH
jgi:SsrA-binding protein